VFAFFAAAMLFSVVREWKRAGKLPAAGINPQGLAPSLKAMP